LGALTAVAVFEHKPEDKELLELRIKHGWSPTPSPLVGGEQILGYAACLVEDSQKQARKSLE